MAKHPSSRRVSSGLRAILDCVIAIVCSIATACTITVAKDTDSEEEPSTTGTPGDAGTIAPFACQEWDAKSAAEIKQLVNASLTRMVDAGMALDGSLLEDKTRMSWLIKDVYGHAGCPLQVPNGDGTALTSAGVNYCGPGRDSPRFYLPTVSRCMNEACKNHDACYAMCSAPLSMWCYFSDTTAPCDVNFLSGIDACTDTSDHWFASTIVSVVAHVISGLNPITCSDVTCPKFGTLGTGPCGLASSSPGCITCLVAVDEGGGCRRTSCAVSPKDDLLYAATCPNVGQCYGGYGFGSAQMVDQITGEVAVGMPPPTATWKLVLLSGTMPDAKGNGDPWDLGEASGFEPPDCYVELHASTVLIATSDIVQDSYGPYWGLQLAGTMTTAHLLGVELQVWDADLMFDDRIGTCRMPDDPSIFNGSPVSLECSTAGLTLLVRVDEQ